MSLNVLSSSNNYSVLLDILKTTTLVAAILRNVGHLITSSLTLFLYLDMNYLCILSSCYASDPLPQIMFTLMFQYLG